MDFTSSSVSKPVDNFHTEVKQQNDVLPAHAIFLVKLHNSSNAQVLFQLFYYEKREHPPLRRCSPLIFLSYFTSHIFPGTHIMIGTLSGNPLF